MEAPSSVAACTVALCLSDMDQLSHWRTVLSNCEWISEWTFHAELDPQARQASLVIVDARSSGAIELNGATAHHPLIIILNPGDPLPVASLQARVIRHKGAWDEAFRCRLSEAAASLLGESWIAIYAESDRTLRRTRDVERELGKFSHDISNPLSIISGNAQLMIELSEELGLTEETMAYVQDIEQACRRVVEELERVQRVREALRVQAADLS